MNDATWTPRFILPLASRFALDLVRAKADLLVTYQRMFLYLNACAECNERLRAAYTNFKPRLQETLSEIWPDFSSSSLEKGADLPDPEYVDGQHRALEGAPAPLLFQAWTPEQEVPNGFRETVGEILFHSVVCLRDFSQYPLLEVYLPFLGFARLIDMMVATEIKHPNFFFSEIAAFVNRKLDATPSKASTRAEPLRE